MNKYEERNTIRTTVVTLRVLGLLAPCLALSQIQLLNSVTFVNTGGMPSRQLIGLKEMMPTWTASTSGAPPSPVQIPTTPKPETHMCVDLIICT